MQPRGVFSAITRRAVLSALAIAIVPLPRSANAAGSAIGAFGAAECRTVECRERIADTPREMETSPLIEELRRRTAENAEKNKMQVKQMTISASGGVVNDAEPNFYRSVRYDGITRIIDKGQVKELERQGFELECPKQAGFPCKVVKTGPSEAT